MSGEAEVRPAETASDSTTWVMGRVQKTFTGHTRRISSVAVSEDSLYLYTGSVDGTSRRWDTVNGNCMMVYENNGHSVTCIHTKGKFLWTGGASFNNTIRKWDVQFGKELGTIEKAQGHKSGITALRTDEEFLYSGSWDGTVRSWKIKDCEAAQVYDGHQAGSQIKALSVGYDHVATGSTDKTCRIFDKKTTECIQVIALEVGICGVLLFENSVFIGTKDSKGYKFCVKTGAKELDLAEPDSVASDLGPDHPSSGFKDFCMSSPKGGAVAAANRSAAHLWDVKTGEVLHTLYEADNVDVNALCLIKAANEVDSSRSFAFTGLDDNKSHMYLIQEPKHEVPVSTVVVASPEKTKGGLETPQPSSCCVVS